MEEKVYLRADWPAMDVLRVRTNAPVDQLITLWVAMAVAMVDAKLVTMRELSDNLPMSACALKSSARVLFESIAPDPWAPSEDPNDIWPPERGDDVC